MDTRPQNHPRNFHGPHPKVAGGGAAEGTGGSHGAGGSGWREEGSLTEGWGRVESLPDSNPSPQGNKGNNRVQWQACMHMPWGEPCIPSFQRHAMDIGCIMDSGVVGQCQQNCLAPPWASMAVPPLVLPHPREDGPPPPPGGRSPSDGPPPPPGGPHYHRTRTFPP